MNIFLYNRYRKIYKTNISLLYVIYKKQKVYITDYFKKNGVIKKVHKHLIEQKSKKIVGGAGDTLKIGSFNVYAWKGYYANRENFKNKFNALIKGSGIELLLTQEDEIENSDDTTESVKAYSLKDRDGIPTRFTFDMCINSHNDGQLSFYRGVTPRNAIIIKDTKFGISIANLHLEGGRFIDLELDDQTFQNYLDIKLGLLREVLVFNPDIVMGDFNSVYCTYEDLLNSMYDAQNLYYDAKRNDDLKAIKTEDENRGYTTNLLKQYLYLQSDLHLIKRCADRTSYEKRLSLDNIISWNSQPFTLLTKAGYVYIEPINIKQGKKINPTNFKGENVIDHAWVKETLLGKYDFRTEIYDGFGPAVYDLYGNMSDHKPLHQPKRKMRQKIIYLLLK